MESRAWLAVIVAALAFGALGYYYGKSDLPEEPYAAEKTVTAVPAGPPTCMVDARLTYDPDTDPSQLTLDRKPIEVVYPETSASNWAICWTLEIRSGDPRPFDQLKLDLTPMPGQNGRPVLWGDPNFKGRQGVWLRFDDEPIWPAGPDPEVTIPYAVIAKLKGSTADLEVDPDVVIRKSSG